MERLWEFALRYAGDRRRRAKLLVVIVVVAMIALARPIYIAGVTVGVLQPLTRPSGVSGSARYVSWIEDGIWFDCGVDSKRNVDTCKAWDSNGRLLAFGDYRLECEGRAATEAELRPSFVGGPDSAIYLFGKDGPRSKTLLPVTNQQQNPCPRVTVTYPPSSGEEESPADKPTKKK